MGVHIISCRCYDVTMSVTQVYVYIIQCICYDVTMLVTRVYILNRVDVMRLRCL